MVTHVLLWTVSNHSQDGADLTAFTTGFSKFSHRLEGSDIEACTFWSMVMP